MAAVVLSLAQVALTLFGARAIGKRVSQIAGWSCQPAILQFAVESGLGFLVLSHLLFALTVLRALSTWSLASILVGLALLVAWDCWPVLRLLFGRAGGFRAGFVQRSPAIHVGVGLYLLWGLLNAILPPTGVDEIVYHLDVPRRLLGEGGTVLFTDNIYAYFPQLGDMLFLFGLGLGGEVAARLFHLVFTLLLGLSVAGFARRSLEAKYAGWAGAILLTVPSVMVIAPTAYVDLIFAFYGFLSLVAALDFLKRGNRRLAVLAGLLAGAAWSVKYTGLQLVLLLLLIILLEYLFEHRTPSWQGLILIPAIGLLVVAPYLTRNLLITGWPLFPFRLIGLELTPGINWDPERSTLFLRWLSGLGTGGTTALVQRVIAPLEVFFAGRFNDMSAYDGVTGPVFLLSLLLLFRRRGDLQIRPLVLFCVGFLYYWAFTTLQVRFLLPVLPVLALLVAVAMARWKSWLLNSLVYCLVAWGVVQGVSEQLKRDPGAYWFGREDRATYLSRRVIGFPLYQTANREIPQDGTLYLVNMGNLGYLLDVPWRADFVFEYYRLEKQLAAATTPDEILAFFTEQRISHLMINERLTLSPTALDPQQSRLLTLFLREYTTPIARNPFDEGQVLMKLKLPGNSE